MILIRTEVAAYEGSCACPISGKRRRRVAPLRGLVGVRAGGIRGRLDFRRKSAGRNRVLFPSATRVVLASY
jgi:hypothetical protein